jgi:fructose-1,6-bisphosphatase I
VLVSRIALADHIRRSGAPKADVLAGLFDHMARASRDLSATLRRAGLLDVAGAAGGHNVSGEEQKKLDVIANEIFVEACRDSGAVCRIVSEELEFPAEASACTEESVVAMFDPLDGSSNADINGPVGTIVSLFQSLPRRHGESEELLRPGRDQIAAAYVLYGPSTLLVYTAGRGTHVFTLEPDSGEFLLSAEAIHVPPRGKIYSTNEGRRNYWHPWTRRFVEYLQDVDPPGGRPYTARYIGALIADLHRSLLSGGVYFYPADLENPKKSSGKLRLMYECNPLALITEQAGGAAATPTERILDVPPQAIHQRMPLFIGSPYEVGLAADFARERK